MAQNAHFISRFFNFRIPEAVHQSEWLMLHVISGLCCSFLVGNLVENRSRPRRRTKQAKQAKHFSKMGRRHRNQGRGMFVKMFFEPTDWCVNPWSNWLVLGLLFNLQIFRTKYSRSDGFLFWGWGLIWDSDSDLKLQQNVTKNVLV